MGDYKNRNAQGYDIKQVLLPTQTLTSAVNGTGMLIGENIELNVKAIVRGAVGNANNAVVVTLQESDDNSTFSLLQVMPSVTGAALEQTSIVRTTKKYVRAITGAVSGTAPSMAGAEVYLES